MERHYKKRFIEQHKLPEANGPLTTKDTNNIRAHPTNQNSSTNLHPVPNNVNPSAISKTKTEKLPTLQISPPKNRRSGVTISKVNPSKKINSKELTSIEAEKRRNNSLIITPIYPAAIPPVLDIEKQTNLQVPQFRVPLVPNLPHVPRLNSAKKSVYNNQALHHVPLHPKPPAPVFTSNNYSTLMQYRSQNENSKSPTSPKKGYEVNDLNVNAKQPTRTYNPRNYPKVLPKSPAVPPQPLPSHSIRNILDMEKPKPAAKIPANYFPPTVNNTERDSGEFQMAYNNFVSKELAERNHVQPTQPYPSESVHPPVNSQENGTLPPFKQTKSRLDNFKPESVIHTSIVKQTAEIVFSGNEFDEMSKDLTTTHRNIIELAGNSSDFATGLLPETPVIPGEICPTPTVHVQGPSDPTISKELVFLSHMLPNEAKGIPTPSTPINAQIDKIIQENVDKVVEEASKYLNLIPATLNVKPATIAQINPQEPPLQPKTVPPSNSREGRVTRPSTSATSTSTGALRLELETPTIGTSLSIPNKNVQSTSNNVVNHEPSSSLVPKACPVVSAQEIIAASSDRIPSISDHVVKEAVNMKEGMEKSANEPTAISSSNLVPKEIATRVYCTNSNVQSTSESVLSENVNQKVEHTAMEIVTTSCNSPDNVQSTSKIENHDEPSLPLVPTESPLDLVVAKKIATPLCTTSTPKKLVEPQQSVSPEMSFTRERIDTLSDLVASDSEALIQKHKSQELVAKSYSSFNRVESVLNRVNVRRIFEIKMVLRKAMARKRRLHFFFSVDQALESPPKKLKLSDNYSDFESNEINENKTIIFLMDYVKSRIKLKNMKPAKNPASTLTKILVPGKFHMLYLKALNNRIFDEIQSLNELTIQTDFVENLPDINNALWKLYDSFLHGGAFTKTRECLLISMQNVLNKLFVKSVEAYGIIISANMAFRWLFMCDVPVIMFSEKRRQFIRLYVPDPKYLKKFLESLNDTPNDEPLNSVEEMHCKKICKALMEVDMELDLSTHREFRKLDEILTPPTSVSSTVSLPNDHPYSSVSSETKDDVKIETKHERCSVITCIKNCTKHETKVEEKMEVEQNEVSTSKLGNTVEANVKLEDKVKMMDESKIDLLDKTKTSPSSYENNVIIIEDEESERERELKAKSKTDQLVSSGLPPSPVPVPRRNKRKLSSEVPDFAPVGGYREEIQWKVILDTTTTYHHRSDASDCSTEPHLPYSPISNIEEDVEEHEPMFLPLEMTGYGGLNPEDVQPLTNPVSDDTPYRYPTCYQLNDPEKIKRLKNASIVFSSLLQPNIGKYRILKSQILDNQKPLRKNHFMPMFGEERHHQILPGFEVHFNDRKISTNFTDDASDCSSDAYTNNLKKQRLCKKARPNYQQNSSSYPKGKMYYYKDSHSLIRYNDDQQMERFLRNVQYPSGDAASNDTEITTLPQDVVFHLKEEISDPVDYINEIDVVKKHVPRDFYSFYKFVSGFQIANRHNPISFTTFLTMHNTNNLKVLLEKYVKTFEEFD